ncbi:MAG: glycine zipper domain-containing protein [Chromatiaceae bacterium]|jgi:uncharacterized membrane protein
MMTFAKPLLVVLLVVGLAACSSMSDTQRRTMTGAGVGAAGGALIGELATGQPLHGAAIGAAVGAASGWLYDRHEKNKKEM